MSFRTNTSVMQSIAAASVTTARGTSVQSYSALLDNISALATTGNANRPLIVNSGGTALVLGNVLGTAAYAATGTAQGNVPLIGAGGKLAASLLPTASLEDFAIFTDGVPLSSNITNARAIYDSITHIAGTTAVVGSITVGDMSGALTLNAGSTANSGCALVGAVVVPFKSGYSTGSSRVYARMKRPNASGNIARLGYTGGDPLNSASLALATYVEIPFSGNSVLKFYNSSGTLVDSLDLGSTTNGSAGNIFTLEMNYDYATLTTRVYYNGILVGTRATPGAVSDNNVTPFVSHNYVSASGSTLALDYFGCNVSWRYLNVA